MFEASAHLDKLFRATTAEGTAGASGALSTGTGGALLPRPLEQVVLISRDRVAKMRKLASSFTMTAQTHTIPTAAAMTGYMTLEGGTTTQGEPTVASVQLTARKGQVMAILTEEMLDDAAINVVNMYATRAGLALGTLEDNQFFKDGSGTAPNVSAYLQGTAFDESVGGTSGMLSYTNVVGMFFALPQAYRAQGKWLIGDDVLILLSALKDGNGRPFYNNMLDAPRAISDDGGSQGTILGRPVFSVPFTAGTIWFGDPSAAYMVGSRQGLQSAVDRSVGFVAGNVYFKISQRFDGHNVDLVAGRNCTGITSVNTL
jgi:HK97 family phage major capsid protein